MYHLQSRFQNSHDVPYYHQILHLLQLLNFSLKFRSLQGPPSLPFLTFLLFLKFRKAQLKANIIPFATLNKYY